MRAFRSLAMAAVWPGLRRGALGAALLCVAAPASAQEGGNGMKAGDRARLHARINASAGSELNPRHISPGEEGATESAVRASVLGALEWRRPSDMFDLSLDLEGEYSHLPGDEFAQVRGFTGAANFAGKFNKKGALQVKVSDRLRHALEPTESLSRPVRHTINDIGLDFVGAPGGGALVIEGGVHHYIDVYAEESKPTVDGVTSDPGSYRVSPSLAGRWRFLPKTAAALELKSDIARYNDSTTPDNEKHSAIISANGNLTSKIQLNIRGGASYARSSYSPEAGADLKYKVNSSQEFTFGVSTSLQQVAIYSTAQNSRASLSYFRSVGKRLTLGAKLEGAYMKFGDPSAAALARAQSAGSTDVAAGNASFNLKMDLDVGFEVNKMLSIRVSDTLERRDASGTNSDYVANTIGLNLTFRY